MDNILDLIGNTPLVQLTQLDTGPCELFVKLENQNPVGSIKDRFERQRIRSVVFGGETNADDWHAKYSASWSKSSERENGSVDPANFEKKFEEDGLNVGMDFTDPRIPAENNYAERELRPTVIARKVSFGSQSDAGAKTRSSLMTLLYTAKKRLKDESLEEWFKGALDRIAEDPTLNIASLLPIHVNPQ